MSEPVFFFGKKGKIVGGEHLGWTVEFVDNTADTGGFYVLIEDSSPQATDLDGFDYWLEFKDDIPDFIKEMNWEIEWE